MADGADANNGIKSFLNKLRDLLERGSPTLLGIGILYVLLYTPVWKPAWVGMAAALTILIALVQGGYKDFFYQQRYFLVIMLLFSIVNTTLSPMPSKAMTGVVGILKGLLLYPAALFAGRMMPENLFIRVGSVFSVCTSVFLLVLLTMVVKSNIAYQSLVNWTDAYLGNLHNLNNLIFMFVLLGLVLLLYAREHWVKGLAAINLILALYFGILVQSEGSYLALSVCLLALAALYSNDNTRRALTLLALMPIIVLHILYLQPDLFVQLAGVGSHTLEIRSEIYAHLLDAWQLHPIMGWGINTYKYSEAAVVDGMAFLYPHHLYLEALFSIGILGCGLAGVWLFGSVRKIHLNQIRHSAISLFAFLALIYISVKGMSDMKLLSQQTVGWIAVCLGLLHGRTQLLQQQQDTP